MREIKGFNGFYLIRESGEIYSLYSNKIRKPRLQNNSYLIADLYVKGVRYQKLVHRLVAETFIDNPLGLPVVNHKDFNKLNNRANNLEWCTYKYNLEYSGTIKRANIATSKAIKQITVNTNQIIKAFNSIMDAERETGISNSNISECCSGKRKTAGGYKWEIV